jgi:uncharacterized protein YqcC (DUF446 family)
MKAALDAIREKLDAIEAEMKGMRWWQQFIFIPRVRSLIESNGPFP